MALDWRIVYYSPGKEGFLTATKSGWTYSAVEDALLSGTYSANWLDAEAFLAANPQPIPLEIVWICQYV
jgi:hypothetical protein